ncbi:MAG: putative zinc-binding metallopeptidase [Bdellovibrionales bacterium]|nr:putative zinc-binding metallopeptidase [Bdellovibrionales bacterium]
MSELGRVWPGMGMATGEAVKCRQVQSGVQGSDQELLRKPLRSFELSLETPNLVRGIRILRSELQRKGLVFAPHFWIGEEWFCPDYIPGISIPFYLLNSRLLELEKRFIGFAEGEKPLELLRVLRHESGHAIENAYGLRKDRLRVEVFGSSRTPYPRSYLPKPYSRKFVRHLANNYAQSHPDEDFAETFAVWLDPTSDWRTKYIGWSALKKIEAMDTIMNSIKGRTPKNRLKNTYEPLHRSQLTLGQYFVKKRRQLSIDKFMDLDEKLSSAFSRSSLNGPKVDQFIMEHRSYLCGQVAEGLGEYKYRVNQVIRRLTHRARELGLRAAPDQKIGPILDIVTAQALDDFEGKRHHIIL